MDIIPVGFIFMSRILLITSQEQCYPCNCYPRGQFETMLCQGREIYDYPRLPSYVINGLRHIEIISTEILSLPTITSDMYGSLQTFVERKNRRFQCDYLQQWFDVLQHTTFDSEKCPLITDKISTTYSITTLSTRFTDNSAPTDLSTIGDSTPSDLTTVDDDRSNKWTFTSSLPDIITSTDVSNGTYWSSNVLNTTMFSSTTTTQTPLEEAASTLIYILPSVMGFVALLIIASLTFYYKMKVPSRLTRRVNPIYIPNAHSTSQEHLELESLESLSDIDSVV